MTLPRLSATNDYQKLHPPVHWLVAAQIGYKPDATPAEKKNNLDELMDIFSSTQGFEVVKSGK